MFKQVTMYCQHKSESECDAHLEMMRGKNGLDESNSGKDSQLRTWWTREEWVNEQVEIED